jgi:hypothetical protein
MAPWHSVSSRACRVYQYRPACSPHHPIGVQCALCSAVCTALCTVNCALHCAPLSIALTPGMHTQLSRPYGSPLFPTSPDNSPLLSRLVTIAEPVPHYHPSPVSIALHYTALHYTALHCLYPAFRPTYRPRMALAWGNPTFRSTYRPSTEGVSSV